MSVTCNAVVKNERGIHARPSALIAKEALKYNSQITVVYEERTANAKDVLQLIMLELFAGVNVQIIAEGDDEQEAMDAVKELLETQYQFD